MPLIWAAVKAFWLILTSSIKPLKYVAADCPKTMDAPLTVEPVVTTICCHWLATNVQVVQTVPFKYIVGEANPAPTERLLDASVVTVAVPPKLASAVLAVVIGFTHAEKVLMLRLPASDTYAVVPS